MALYHTYVHLDFLTNPSENSTTGRSSRGGRPWGLGLEAALAGAAGQPAVLVVVDSAGAIFRDPRGARALAAALAALGHLPPPSPAAPPHADGTTGGAATPLAAAAAAGDGHEDAQGLGGGHVGGGGAPGRLQLASALPPADMEGVIRGFGALPVALAAAGGHPQPQPPPQPQPQSQSQPQAVVLPRPCAVVGDLLAAARQQYQQYLPVLHGAALYHSHSHALCDGSGTAALERQGTSGVLMSPPPAAGAPRVPAAPAGGGGTPPVTPPGQLALGASPLKPQSVSVGMGVAGTAGVAVAPALLPGQPDMGDGPVRGDGPGSEKGIAQLPGGGTAVAAASAPADMMLMTAAAPPPPLLLAVSLPGAGPGMGGRTGSRSGCALSAAGAPPGPPPPPPGVLVGRGVSVRRSVSFNSGGDHAMPPVSGESALGGAGALLGLEVVSVAAGTAPGGIGPASGPAACLVQSLTPPVTSAALSQLSQQQQPPPLLKQHSQRAAPRADPPPVRYGSFMDLAAAPLTAGGTAHASTIDSSTSSSRGDAFTALTSPAAAAAAAPTATALEALQLANGSIASAAPPGPDQQLVTQLAPYAVEAARRYAALLEAAGLWRPAAAALEACLAAAAARWGPRSVGLAGLLAQLGRLQQLQGLHVDAEVTWRQVRARASAVMRRGGPGRACGRRACVGCSQGGAVGRAVGVRGAVLASADRR